MKEAHLQSISALLSGGTFLLAPPPPLLLLFAALFVAEETAALAAAAAAASAALFLSLCASRPLDDDAGAVACAEEASEMRSLARSSGEATLHTEWLANSVRRSLRMRRLKGRKKRQAVSDETSRQRSLPLPGRRLT